MENLKERIKKENIYQKLMQIKKNPKKYLQEKSLSYLYSFINGYYLGDIFQDNSIFSLIDNFNFNKFVSDKFKDSSSHNFLYLILNNCFSEEEAFDLFYDLYEQYIKACEDKINVVN